MNERIRRLMEQAGFLNKDEESIGYFAELLIRECMKVADEGMAQVTMKVEWPSYHIKKHFGVEE